MLGRFSAIVPSLNPCGNIADLSDLNTTVDGAKFGFGDFLNTVIGFWPLSPSCPS